MAGMRDGCPRGGHWLGTMPHRLISPVLPLPHRAVGTIFGIYKAKHPGSGNYSLEDVMRVRARAGVGPGAMQAGERLRADSDAVSCWPHCWPHCLRRTARHRDGGRRLLHVRQHELHDDHHGQGRGRLHAGPYPGCVACAALCTSSSGRQAAPPDLRGKGATLHPFCHSPPPQASL